jgi:hypothetical protein
MASEPKRSMDEVVQDATRIEQEINDSVGAWSEHPIAPEVIEVACGAWIAGVGRLEHAMQAAIRAADKKRGLRVEERPAISERILPSRSWMDCLVCQPMTPCTTHAAEARAYYAVYAEGTPERRVVSDWVKSDE